MAIDALRLRANVIKAIRDFFWERGFLEVETPLLIPANAPEEYINPVFTALPAWQLQTSPELCMKRLLARGHHKIFQISHCWRANERGGRHLAEFTMLEWYRADCDYRVLMDDCIGLLNHVATSCSACNGAFEYNDLRVDPAAPWHYFGVREAFMRFGNIGVEECLAEGRYEEVLTATIEPALAKCATPVILMDYPAELAALARTKQEDSSMAERFELYVAGVELANGFSELIDPHEQRRRFNQANLIRKKMGQSELPLPEAFLSSLALMPEAAGIALGVDRLVMLTAGVATIDEVVAFTPEDL
jgi:lysyl-tRNA synthetase class 2